MTTQPFDTTATEKVLTSLNQAQHSTQPFLGAGTGDTPVVVGDLNNIDNEADYYVEFLYPRGYAIQGEFTETEQGLHVIRKFSRKKISPRKARRMRHATSVMVLYFSKVNEATGIQEVMTLSDVAVTYGHLSDEVIDSLETILQTTLGISDMDMEYVTDKSLLNVVGDIIVNNSGFFQRDTE